MDSKPIRERKVEEFGHSCSIHLFRGKVNHKKTSRIRKCVGCDANEMYAKNKVSAAEVPMSTGLWMSSWRLPTPRNRLRILSQYWKRLTKQLQ